MLNLQNSIIINKIEYEIKTDFRIWLKFQEIIENLKEDEESFLKILSFFIEIGLDFEINHFDEAFEKVVEFFIGKNQYGSSTTSKNEKVFDFKKDESYVYSAFLQEYRIDLYDIEELHWHKFKSLLHSLSDNCELTKIIGYRSADTSKMDKEQKKFYNKMKRMYSLEDETEKMTTEEYHNNIYDRINKRFLEAEKEVK